MVTTLDNALLEDILQQVRPLIGQGKVADYIPALAEVAADRGYALYVARQEVEIASMRRDGAIAIPRGDALRGVAGLSSEMVERLERSAPATLDHARRVRGITPAALSALWLHARRSA